MPHGSTREREIEINPHTESPEREMVEGTVRTQPRASTGPRQCRASFHIDERPPTVTYMGSQLRFSIAPLTVPRQEPRPCVEA